MKDLLLSCHRLPRKCSLVNCHVPKCTRHYPGYFRKPRSQNISSCILHVVFYAHWAMINRSCAMYYATSPSCILIRTKHSRRCFIRWRVSLPSLLLSYFLLFQIYRPHAVFLSPSNIQTESSSIFKPSLR